MSVPIRPQKIDTVGDVVIRARGLCHNFLILSFRPKGEISIFNEIKNFRFLAFARNDNFSYYDKTSKAGIHKNKERLGSMPARRAVNRRFFRSWKRF